MVTDSMIPEKDVLRVVREIITQASLWALPIDGLEDGEADNGWAEDIREAVTRFYLAKAVPFESERYTVYLYEQAHGALTAAVDACPETSMGWPFKTGLSALASLIEWPGTDAPVQLYRKLESLRDDLTNVVMHEFSIEAYEMGATE